MRRADNGEIPDLTMEKIDEEILNPQVVRRRKIDTVLNLFQKPRYNLSLQGSLAGCLQKQS